MEYESFKFNQEEAEVFLSSSNLDDRIKGIIGMVNGVDDPAVRDL